MHTINVHNATYRTFQMNSNIVGNIWYSHYFSFDIVYVLEPRARLDFYFVLCILEKQIVLDSIYYTKEHLIREKFLYLSILNRALPPPFHVIKIVFLTSSVPPKSELLSSLLREHNFFHHEFLCFLTSQQCLGREEGRGQDVHQRGKNVKLLSYG